jgi:hypothetical protein
MELASSSLWAMRILGSGLPSDTIWLRDSGKDFSSTFELCYVK